MGAKRIDIIFKQLFERAGLSTNKILRWHTFRKLVLRTAVELGINTWSAKMLVGKSVPVDMSTYIKGTNLKNDFIKLSSVLKLKPTYQGNGKTKQALDLIFEVLKNLVAEKLKHSGDIALGIDLAPTDWESLYEQIRDNQK